MSAFPFRESVERVVITGGPGAGKTAVLELARRELCKHVEVLPEAAGIVFTGGFPRHRDDVARRSAQRAIHFVQRELEVMALSHPDTRLALCDRGTIDALAYWPGSWDEFFADVGSSLEYELGRYAAVIHLRVPQDPKAYKASELRVESHEEALAIDRRLLEVWSRHPHHVTIGDSVEFLRKAERAVEEIRKHRPKCCGKE